MKRSRLSYEDWSCILAKDIVRKRVDTELLTGYIGLIRIYEVSEPQIWTFQGHDLVVCDRGIQWLTILPADDWYCITAMLDDERNILLWYIDMIAAQGVDTDGVPYFDDLYLDLVVFPDGSVMVDDMDELEQALAEQDITQEQFKLAEETSIRLKNGLLKDITSFIEFTNQCGELLWE